VILSKNISELGGENRIEYSMKKVTPPRGWGSTSENSSSNVARDREARIKDSEEEGGLGCRQSL